MDDRVCSVCGQILRWAGPATQGQYRHCRPSGALYITTHAPVLAPEVNLSAARNKGKENV